MNRARFTAALVAGCTLAFVAVSGALAASPQQIYADYADNGRLDGNYSKSDLQRALKSAVVQGYGHGQTQGLKPAIKDQITTTTTTPPPTPPPATTTTTEPSSPTTAEGSLGAPPVKKSGGLPFTGLDLGLIALGAFSLLLFGAALRRFARQKP
jgi:hypothetical protein